MLTLKLTFMHTGGKRKLLAVALDQTVADGPSNHHRRVIFPRIKQLGLGIGRPPLRLSHLVLLSGV